MRAYFFGNLYLSSIQQGIQAAHATHELFLKYDFGALTTNFQVHLLFDWAKYHKTMILLNGGYSENLRTIADFFDTPQNPYPWVEWHEGQDALDGALTCVSIVLPEKIYALAKELRNPHQEHTSSDIKSSGIWSPLDYDTCVRLGTVDITKFELELAFELNKYGLAS